MNPFSEFSNKQATQLFAVGTAANSGDNTLIAAPGAGQRIVLVGGQLQNESSADTTVLLKYGSTSIYRLNMSAKSYGALPPAPLYWRLPVNTSLVGNLSGANQIGFVFWYYLETI